MHDLPTLQRRVVLAEFSWAQMQYCRPANKRLHGARHLYSQLGRSSESCAVASVSAVAVVAVAGSSVGSGSSQ
eukprot:3521-Heterococcus_DN1.PRE.2